MYNRQKTFPKVKLKCKLRCNSSYTATTAETEWAALLQIWWCSECLYKLVQLVLESQFLKDWILTTVITESEVTQLIQS